MKVSSTTAKVPIGRGVRQGCRIAPMLWAIATAVIMQRTNQSMGWRWTQDHLTAYADDFHAGERVCKCTDLDRSLWRFGAFLDQLIDASLQVNTKKSAILLRLTRGFAPSWQRSYVRKGPDGPFLHFSTPSGRCFDIPIIKRDLSEPLKPS